MLKPRNKLLLSSGLFLSLLWLAGWAAIDQASAAASWTSPGESSTQTVNTSVRYSWQANSNTNYIRFGPSGGSWGGWNYTGGTKNYDFSTGSVGWWYAQVATLEGGDYQYSSALGVYYQPPACSPSDSNWSGWTDTSSCTVSCGTGTKTQSRSCVGSVSCGGSNNCTGLSTQTVSCNTQACAVNGGCGTNAAVWDAGSSSYTGSFCGSGSANPGSPSFPGVGSYTNWACNGANGGSNASCTSYRRVATPTLSVSPAAVAVGGTLTFSWNAVTNATTYYIAFQRNGVWDGSWTSAAAATSYDFSTSGLSGSVVGQVMPCSASVCGYVTNNATATIAIATNVDFTASPTSGTVPLAVAFTSSNTGGTISGYSWNFGDGPPAGSGANPSRTYAAAGTYSVTVLASGVGGNSTKSRTNYITVNPAAPVDAVISVSPTVFAPAADVTFSWNAPANATYYYIAYRRDGTWGAAANIGNVVSVVASTSGLTSSLAAGVYACNVSGCSPDGSNVAVATLAPVPTADIKANNSNGNVNISYNTAATISWTSSNASSCSVSPGNWTGTSNTGQSTGNLRTTTTYTLTCTGLGGTATDSIAVNVPTPTVSVDSLTAANPAGGTAPVNGVDFTTTVSGSGIGNINYKIDCTNNGSDEVDITTASNPYTAVDACNYGTGGNYTAKVVATRDLVAASRTAALTIGYPASTADIKVNNSDGPVYLNINTQYSLSWSSTNATACTASGDWSGNQSLQGSITFTLISTAKTYTITCTGLGATATDSITVSPIPAAAANLRITSATPYIKGDTISFAWDAAQAATYYMIGYYLNGAWDFNWVAPSPQSATTIAYGASTASLNSLGAVVVACKSPAVCSAPTSLVTATLLDPTPANITTSGTATSPNPFNISLSGSADVKYVKIDPTTIDLLYRVRVFQGSPNPSATVTVVDGSGTPINSSTTVRQESLAPVGTDIIVKVPATSGGEKYLKFQGTRAGNFTYTLKRVRLFPYLEAQ